MFRPLLFPQVENRKSHLQTTLEHLACTPNKVAHELRKLHVEHSPERFRAMILIRGSISEEFDLDDAFFGQLIGSELPTILFDIACDSSNYDYPMYTDQHIVCCPQIDNINSFHLCAPHRVMLRHSLDASGCA